MHRRASAWRPRHGGQVVLVHAPAMPERVVVGLGEVSAVRKAGGGGRGCCVVGGGVAIIGIVVMSSNGIAA